jgi:AcrR family transcriptional regulator
MTTRALDRGADRASARDRLLAAATELFYAEGVHSVGIDRVIERAGVAKASLYSTFGSKDELIRAYLEGRHEATRTRMTRGLDRYDTARERLIGVFDVQAETYTRSGFRGCAFVSASAEARPGSSIEQVSEDYRVWVRTLFLDLATAAGAPDAAQLAGQLVLLYDGAGVGGWMDKGVSPDILECVRSAASTLVDAAFAAA